jgi:predicted porin
VRKYLAIILGVMLIMGLSATAHAIHETVGADESPVVVAEDTEIMIGGKITTKGWYLDNIDPFGNEYGLSPWLPRRTNSQAFYASTFNLDVDVHVNDNVQGMVEIETGVGESSGLYYWGSYDSKPNDGDLWIRQLWIQYAGSGLLGIPSGIKIGHMPLSLGEKIFLDNERFGDDAIVVWIDPLKELHIAAATAKIQEGPGGTEDLYDHSTDLDAYALLGTYMIDKDNTIGLNWTWSHSDSNVPAFGGAKHNVEELNHHNFGLHANGTLNIGDGLTYGAEVDWQTGTIDGADAAGGEDIDLNGWGCIAKLGYMLDPVNIRAMFAYGSGDDDATDNDFDEMQTFLGPDYGFTARKVHVARVYERAVRTASIQAGLTTGDIDITNTGIANTTVYNLGLDIEAMKDLTFTLDGFILQASETGAWEDTVGGNVDDDLGWEVDVTMNYKIAKNLNYFVEAGYFKAGDFYEDAHGIDAKGAVLASHGIALTF